MTRKRNNKCRSSICACTGVCFVDDGTGDFAPKLSDRQKLCNINDALIGDILKMSDTEIMQQALEEFGSQEAVDAEVERLREIARKAIENARIQRTKG